MPPPPAPRPSRANEDKKKSKIKGAPKNDRPKAMPEANRDKCGACSENHDIRYCPYPNTEDGRTKICPICNTTKHAWFECWYYKRDVTEQWTVCWANRRCLPVLVHDAPLDEIFHSKVSLERETSEKEETYFLEDFDSLPGPLSPAFVKKLMPPDVGDDHIRHELQEARLGKGRLVPWELSRMILEESRLRGVCAVRDRLTMDMRIHRFIDGTRSSAGHVPAARKQGFFYDMDNAIKANNDVYNQILAKKPLHSIKATKASFTSPEDKWDPDRDDEMALISDDCGAVYPVYPKIQESPAPCKQCGMSMENHHTGSFIGGQCGQGCMCSNEPRHVKAACNRLCRLCIMTDPDSTTTLKDCKRHCPFHLCRLDDGNMEEDHSQCMRDHKACPTCKERHWHQDCPQWLGTLCVRQDCLATQCNIHCRICGGQNIDEIMAFFPNNDNVAYRQQVQSLVQTWHRYLHSSQWERISVPDIKRYSWSAVRCRYYHGRFLDDERTLEQLRAATWKAVAECVLGGFTEETITEAERLLKLPECRACFDWRYEAGTGDFDARTPGKKGLLHFGPAQSMPELNI